MIYTPSQAAAIPMPSWVLPGWFRSKTLTLLSAPGGVGKSNLATALALHAAAGRGFLELAPPEKPARVLYLALDAASWDYAQAMRRIAQGMGVDLEGFDVEDWSGGLWWRFDSILLKDPKTFEGVMNDAAYPSGAPVDLVIVDSLRAVHDEDENDSQAMMKVMRFFRAWAEANCAVLLLHHSKKPGEFTSQVGWDSARGSGVIHNSVDSHIVLRTLGSPKFQAQHPNEKLVLVNWAKGRGGDSTESLKYKMAWSAESLAFSRVKRGRPKKEGSPNGARG